MRHARIAIVLCAIVASAAAARAQNATPAAAPAGLTIVQVQYGGGGDWYANPSSLPNLLREIRERTGITVAERPAQLKLSDPAVWKHPYLYVTGHGAIRFTDEEIAGLRRYLLSGGFLHIDDNYGMDEHARREIRRLFPDRDLVELPHDHPVYHSFYSMPQGLPKVHEHDGKPAQGFGILHEGRLVLYYSYESDLGDGWEDPAVHDNPPEVREAALRMGVNLFVHAITQEVR